MATIGLKDVYYAKLISDPVGGVPTYQPPVKIKGAMSANMDPNTSSETLFSDDGPSQTAATLGKINLELNVEDLSLPIQADILGHTYQNGVLKRKASDVPPWIAIGYRTLKANGAYRYMWLAKGKFAIPKEEYETKGDSISFKTPTITGSFVKRDSDEEWERSADEDDPGFIPSYVDTWFLDPVTPEGGYVTAAYGDATVTISGNSTMKGKTVAIVSSTSTALGSETAAWTTDTLTITLHDGGEYSASTMQTLINDATGTAPGKLTYRATAPIVASTAVTWSKTLA
jgi:phi13 family phage major tail protein